MKSNNKKVLEKEKVVRKTFNKLQLKNHPGIIYSDTIGDYRASTPN